MDVVGIVTVQDEDVLHALAGCYWKFTRLVGVYGARVVSSQHGCETRMCAGAVGESWRGRVKSVRWFWFLWYFLWWFGLCAFGALSQLVHMAHGRGFGLWWMLSQSLGGESGESCDPLVIYCFL